MNESLQQWLAAGSFFSYKDYKIFYRQFGSAAENLIIIHGYPFSSYEWKEVIPLLSDNFRVTVFDLLGMGFSDKPEHHHYSFEEYADLINKLILYLKIEQTHILAHNLGANIAQELLAIANEDNLNFSIASMCFTNGNLFNDVYQPRPIQRLLSQSPDCIGRFLSKRIGQKTVHKTIRQLYGKYTQPKEDFLNELWEILTYKNGKNIAYRLGKLVFQKSNYQQRWTKSMGMSTIPMSYLCGPADPNSGLYMGIHFQKKLPSGKLLWMGDSIGHWPMIEDKIEFVTTYYCWLSETIPKR